MFILALIIGIYSYILFFLGIFSLLNPFLITLITVIFVICIFYSLAKTKLENISEIKSIFSENSVGYLILFLIISLIFINLVGALGPELSFDSLWYHLTIPKIFLDEGGIRFLDGGLFYYSVMPKAIDLLYIPALFFGNEIVAKLIHFIFGIFSLFVLYNLSRIFLNRFYSLLVVLIFYSNLVVAWLSITSYIDLGRTFFELVAFYYLITFIKNESNKDLYKSGVILGLSITTKLLSFGTMILSLLILVHERIGVRKLALYITIPFLIISPWLLFAYVNTGNPVFPFFSSSYSIGLNINPLNIMNFIRSPDPISPIYLISLPLIFAYYKKFSKLEKIVIIYSFTSFIIWLFTPQTGGGRFIVPYLPIFSIAVVVAISKTEFMQLKKIMIGIIIFIALLTVVYRGVANARYLPVVLGYQSKDDFLSQNLNFEFGDYYDVDGRVAEILDKDTRTLIIGGHNLYYMNFQFVHSSYANPDDKFTHIMIIDMDMPQEFIEQELIYMNTKTNVKIYKYNGKNN